MKFALVIDLGNAAFDDDPSPELARLLRHTAKQVQNGFYGQNGETHVVRDINGNIVGHFLQVQED